MKVATSDRNTAKLYQQLKQLKEKYDKGMTIKKD